jgi:hypothetical protein
MITTKKSPRFHHFENHGSINKNIEENITCSKHPENITITRASFHNETRIISYIFKSLVHHEKWRILNL